MRTTTIASIFSLHQVCYQLGSCNLPPKIARGRSANTIEQHLAVVPQPEIRTVMVRYVKTMSSVLRPEAVQMKVQSTLLLSEYLAEFHPKVKSLRQLDRARHIDPFIVWNVDRMQRGNKAHLKRKVARQTASRTVADLRLFFDDLAAWGWAERPKRQLFFTTGIARAPDPLPRRLRPIPTVT